MYYIHTSACSLPRNARYATGTVLQQAALKHCSMCCSSRCYDIGRGQGLAGAGAGLCALFTEAPRNLLIHFTLQTADSGQPYRQHCSAICALPGYAPARSLYARAPSCGLTTWPGWAGRSGGIPVSTPSTASQARNLSSTCWDHTCRTAALLLRDNIEGQNVTKVDQFHKIELIAVNW